MRWMAWVLCLGMLAAAGVVQAADGPAIPAVAVGAPFDCTAQGGWRAAGGCYRCPARAPERTREPPLGARACTKPKGMTQTKARRRLATRTYLRLESRLTCRPGETKRGQYCFSCPPVMTLIGTTCRGFRGQKFARAVQIAPARCGRGAMLGVDGGCYRCPRGTVVDTGVEGTARCLLDAKGSMPGVRTASLAKDAPRRSRIEETLAPLLGHGADSADDAERIAAMRAIIENERKTPAVPFVLWLREDPDDATRAIGGAMAVYGRKADAERCYRYTARTRRFDGASGAPMDAAPRARETVLIGWGAIRALGGVEMIGYLVPDADAEEGVDAPKNRGVAHGYDWLKYPKARRMVWENVAPEAAYYRHITLFAVGAGARVDCDTLRWP